MPPITIDKLVRSKRKTLALEVARNGTLIVRAPKRAPVDFINKFILDKQSWIEKRQKIAQERVLQSTPKTYTEGEVFLYLGDNYTLRITDDMSAPLVFNGEFRLSQQHLPYARHLFTQWYKRQAYRKIKERLDWYSDLSGIKYKTITVTNARNRWGACNHKGDLRFSWRLIMAKIAVIDYIVIHELVHTIERNHSKQFWNRVRDLIPDYKESHTWLKENGHTLVI